MIDYMTYLKRINLNKEVPIQIHWLNNIPEGNPMKDPMPHLPSVCLLGILDSWIGNLATHYDDIIQR